MALTHPPPAPKKHPARAPTGQQPHPAAAPRSHSDTQIRSRIPPACFGPCVSRRAPFTGDAPVDLQGRPLPAALADPVGGVAPAQVARATARHSLRATAAGRGGKGGLVRRQGACWVVCMPQRRSSRRLAPAWRCQAECRCAKRLQTPSFLGSCCPRGPPQGAPHRSRSPMPRLQRSCVPRCRTRPRLLPRGSVYMLGRGVRTPRDLVARLPKNLASSPAPPGAPAAPRQIDTTCAPATFATAPRALERRRRGTDGRTDPSRVRSSPLGRLRAAPRFCPSPKGARDGRCRSARLGAEISRLSAPLRPPRPPSPPA